MWPLAVGLPSLGCGSRGESLVSVLSVSLLSAFFFFFRFQLWVVLACARFLLGFSVGSFSV